VLSEMILGNGIGGRLCEGWFIWSIVIKITELVQYRATNVSNIEIELTPSSSGAPDRLRQLGLLNNHEGGKPSETGAKARYLQSSRHISVWLLFWTAVQYTMITITAFRSFVVALMTASSLPSRASISMHAAEPSTSTMGTVPQQAIPTGGTQASSPSTPSPLQPGKSWSNGKGDQALRKRPVVSMQLWSCIGHLLQVDVRMPWLSGLLSLVHDGVVGGWGKVGDTDGALDR
jgi:hypothetical protein